MIDTVGTRMNPFDGDRLRTARVAKGWPQARLAGHLGKAVSTVYAWEANVRTPSPGALKEVAMALDVAPADLLSTPRREYLLEDFRVVNGFRQQEVATAIGVPLSLIGQLENGYFELEPDVTSKLAAEYNATGEEIEAAWQRGRDHLESSES